MRRFIQRLRPTPDETLHAASVRESTADPQRITRVVTERLAEDESLRGRLTDEGFGPVLDFATSLIPGAVRTALRHLGAQEAEDEVSHHVRALVRGIVDAAEQGEPSVLLGHLSAPLFGTDEAIRLRDIISSGLQLGESSDARARHVVAMFRAALREQPR